MKCLDSANIVFDESTFPAKDTNHSHGSCTVTVTPGNSLTSSPLSTIPQIPTFNSTTSVIHLPSPNIAISPTISNESASTPTHFTLASHETLHLAQPPLTSTTHTNQSYIDVASLSATQPCSPLPPIANTEQSPSDNSSSILPTVATTSSLPSISCIITRSQSAVAANNALPSISRMITRSQTGNLKPRQFPDFKMLHSTRHPLICLHSISLPPTPSTYKQAAAHPQWIEAMTSEYKALISNHTWTLCPRPLNHNAVRNKWVFKIKQKPNGSVDRFKARLVAKGFDQKCGIDYHETFSSVIKPATIRILLTLAVQFNWELRQLDVSNAFLHGILDEEPPGFIDPSCPDFVCRLHKSIYGLKQAPRAWFTQLTHALLNLGFLASQVDYSLFTYHQRQNPHLHIDLCG